VDKDKNIQYYVGRLGQLRAVFDVKKKRYKELRRWLAPNTGNFEEDDPKRLKNQYFKDIINTMPYKYNITLATMLGSNFTSPAVRWFKMNQRNKKPTREEKRYFQEVENVEYDTFEDANLHPTLNNVYLEAQTYGVGASYMVKKRSGKPMRFRPLTIGEFYIEDNVDGEVDVLYRHFTLDLRQLEQMFGLDNVPNKYKIAIMQGKYDQDVTIWHSVEPNNNYLEAWENKYNKPFVSAYFIEGCHDGLLEMKGMSYFPYFVARWDKFGSDPYGVGVGITALGDIKMLQKYERDLAKASSKKILPNVKLPTSMRKQKTDLSAGKPIFVDGKDAVTAAFQINYDTREARENIKEIEQRLYTYFYNDVFFAMLGADKTMSATEAAARNSEKLQMLGGIVTRWQKDFLEPIITTTYIALGERGELPDAPESLQGKTIDIDYHGTTFQSIALADLSMLERYIQLSAGVEAVKPGSLDWVNGDEIMKHIAEKMDVPVDTVNSQETVDGIRAQRAKQQQMIAQKEQAEAFESAGAAAKDFSQANTTGENMLAQMMGER